MIQPKVVVQISLILNNVIGNLEKTALYKGKITKIAGPSFLGVGRHIREMVIECLPTD